MPLPLAECEDVDMAIAMPVEWLLLGVTDIGFSVVDDGEDGQFEEVWTAGAGYVEEESIAARRRDKSARLPPD